MVESIGVLEGQPMDKEPRFASTVGGVETEDKH